MTLVEVICAVTIVSAVLAATFTLLGQLRGSQHRTATEAHALGVARSALYAARLSGDIQEAVIPGEAVGSVHVTGSVETAAAEGLRTTRVIVQAADRSGNYHEVVRLASVDLVPRALPELEPQPAEADPGPSMHHLEVFGDESAGTVTAGGDFAHGTSVLLTATPGPGRTFDHWDGAVLSPNSPSTQVIVNGDKVVTAIFGP